MLFYAPTEQNPSWQVDIAKGKNIPSCGFVQYQYSQKVEQGKKFQRLSKVKIVKNLQKYLVARKAKHYKKRIFLGNVKVISITKTYTRSNST